MSLIRSSYDLSKAKRQSIFVCIVYYFIITWYLAKPHVPLVTVHGVVGPNVVHAGQEVESVPVPLLQRLLSWPHWQHPSLLQPRLVDQDGVGVAYMVRVWIRGPSYTPLFMGSLPVSWSSICLLCPR